MELFALIFTFFRVSIISKLLNFTLTNFLLDFDNKFLYNRDCRSLIVEMVLATDMNQHFEQIKHMEDFLQRPDMYVGVHSNKSNHFFIIFFIF